MPVPAGLVDDWIQRLSLPDGELERWRAGTERPLVENATQSGHALIDCDRVEACLATLKVGRIAEGIKALQELVPEVAPLPKFEVDAGK